MRTTLLILALALLAPAAIAAQQPVELPDYTDDQLWARASGLSVVLIASFIGYAEEQGQDIDEFAAWWTDTFAPSWGEPGSYGPDRVMRGMRLNWLSFHGGAVEVLEHTGQVASARFNRAPYLDVFGEDGTLYGVPVEDYETLFGTFAAGVAEYHGLEFSQEISDDGWVMTFRRP